MLTLLCRLTPDQWATVNARYPGAMLIQSDPPRTRGPVPHDLDGYDGSGLYEDSDTGLKWIVQYTCESGVKALRFWLFGAVFNPPPQTEELSELVELASDTLATANHFARLSDLLEIQRSPDAQRLREEAEVLRQAAHEYWHAALFPKVLSCPD